MCLERCPQCNNICTCGILNHNHFDNNKFEHHHFVRAIKDFEIDFEHFWPTEHWWSL